MENQFDLIIIGGGPGGYVCAIRAAQLGMKTAIIEKRSTLGGTCVNVGCIPSKALLDSSEKYHQAAHSFKDHGIEISSVKLNLARMMERKTQIVKELTDGLNFLMNKNKITVLEGAGRLTKAETGSIEIQVTGKGAGTYRAKSCVIATGSDVIALPDVPVDGKNIIISDQAIALEKVPENLVIIGAGVIGLELGSFWSRLGSKVTFIEALPDILMGFDRQMRELARRVLEKQGLSFLFDHKVLSAKSTGSKAVVVVENKAGEKKEIQADTLLVAVGRKPYVDGLGAKELGIQFTVRGRIQVDRYLQTNIPGIYAIGDVIEGPMLAHKAQEEGVMIAELLAGKPGHVNHDTIPFIVYTWPEIAWVGKSEEQLTSEGIAYSTGKFLFRPNGRAKAMNEKDGQVKIIADKKTDRVLGVAIVGPNASELISEAVIAMEFGASSEDIARSFHAHPTLSEAVKEAALDVEKRAIHS